MVTKDSRSMKVHQVKGRLVNSYVVEEHNRLFVVDVAVMGEKYVIGYIEDVMQRSVQEVDLVLATHDDPDHIGGVRQLAKQCNAEIALPLAAHSPVAKLMNDPTGAFFRSTLSFREMFRARAWDMYFNPNRSWQARHKPSRELDVQLSDWERRAPPDYALKDGNSLAGFPNWVVIHTPGHSWDSCCYFHTRTKSLIAGDMLLGSGKKGYLVTPSIYSNPVQMAKSIKRMQALDPRYIYPGHGSLFEGHNLLAHLG